MTRFQCSHCTGEWYISKSQPRPVICCPFCGKALSSICPGDSLSCVVIRSDSSGTVVFTGTGYYGFLPASCGQWKPGARLDTRILSVSTRTHVLELAPAEIPRSESPFEIREGHLLRFSGSQSQVVIPEGVTVIGAAAFAGNTDLISITFPSSLTAIEAEAFRGCVRLTQVHLPRNVHLLGAKAFAQCTGLEAVTLPAELMYLNRTVFLGCDRLRRIILPKNGCAVSLNGLSSQVQVFRES